MEHQLTIIVLKKTDHRRHATMLAAICWLGQLHSLADCIGRYGWRYYRRMIRGDSKWFALLNAIIPAIWVAGYFTFLRRAMNRFNKMENKHMAFRFTEQMFGARSELGNAEIPWKMFERVQQYPDVWLLFLGRTEYTYLPTKALSTKLKAFILKRFDKGKEQ